jgi:hypothetical protein
LELPIDHFRLLGVSPATDAHTVLRTLQHRLDHPPDQGFTHEALQARAELLRASADLLSDADRRAAYESDLTALESSGGAVAPGLDVQSPREVGALILMLEAGQPLDAFEAAGRCLQPPQAPALGSSREADLSLLAALACQAGADELARGRHFEEAASLLREGLQLLQRMGQVPEQRRRLEHDLEALLPFRVLHLLSRDLTATAERSEGLELLNTLVARRGGLEGDADPDLPREDFQRFFKQIRQYLTVQEQVDLFSRWAAGGSATAAFLASVALTASGFAQRKPERIATALQRLASGGEDGLEPLLACQYLLLGEIEPAQQHFARGASEELRRWSAQHGDDPLAQLCAYCRDWLSRDVLPGYRDIDVDADLEAYFADRDVQSYVEQQDRRQSRSATPPAAGETGWLSPSLEPPLQASPDPFAAADLAAGPGESPREAGAGEPFEDEGLSPVRWPRLRLPPWQRTAAVALVAAAAAGGGWIVLRPSPRPAVPPPTAARPLPSPPKPGPVPAATPRPQPPAKAAPLTAQTPSDAEIRNLLQAWLRAKAAVLAGEAPPLPPADLARSALVGDLLAQGRANAARGQRETVNATIETLEVTRRGPRRIEADVRLRYSDQLQDAAGRVITSTGESELRNVYVFARDGDTWKLADFRTRR